MAAATMNSKHLAIYFALLLLLLSDLRAECRAGPLTDLDTLLATPLDIDDSFADDYNNSYQTRPAVASKESLLSRLRRGYYYIENGEITPVDRKNVNTRTQTISRRQDVFPTEKDISKHKKLFVPNLFG